MSAICLTQPFSQLSPSTIESAGKATLDSLRRSELLPVNASTKTPLRDILVIGQLIKEQLVTHCNQSLYFEVAERVTALRYRIGVVKPSRSPRRSTVSALIRTAEAWKKAEPLIRNGHLTAKEVDLLSDACRFPHFAKLLSDDKKLADRFFEWTLRGRCGAEFFIKHPTARNRVMECLIHHRMRRFGDHTVCTAKLPEGLVPAILAEGKPVSLLDESVELKLANGLTETLRNSLEANRDRNHRWGPVDFQRDGFTNWHQFEHGPLNPTTNQYERVDLDIPEWWTHLPLFTLITEEQVVQEYGVGLEGNWMVATCGSREKPYLTLKGHAWLEIVVRQADGMFRVYPFGKSVKKYPIGLIAEAAYVGSTDPYGAVVYPDKNPFRIDRERAHRVFHLDENEFQRLMGGVRKDILRARKNTFFFQGMGENCAYWVWQSVVRACPTRDIDPMYQIKFHEPRHSPPAGWFLAMNRVPPWDWVRLQISRFFMVLFGAWRSVKIKGKSISAWNNKEIWDHAIAHVPGGLWKRD
jgi:hypothetical protein